MSQNHKTQQEIRQDIEFAASQIEIGGIYRHYKNENMTYLVKEIGFDTETKELSVIYRAQYGEGVTFVRMLKLWTEKVDWHGELVPRFVKVV